MSEPRSDTPKAPPAQGAGTAPRDEAHVPPEAEDFFHVLKRLAAEKEDRRARSPDLYR
jgi:hypothetical protein